MGHLLAVLWLLCVPTFGLAVANEQARVVLVMDSPSPTPSPTPATLDISVTASHQTVARQESLDVFIIVSNKTATVVNDLQATLTNSTFSLKDSPISFLSPLPGYQSTQATASIQAQPDAQFLQHQVLFVFTYSWFDGSHVVSAIQVAPVTLQVVRPFDEEAKGLLGAGAALLYLVLPIIPLVLGYELLDGPLSGKFRLPTFGTEYVLPAFLFAVLINLFLLVINRQRSLDYTAPVAMIVILVASFALGCGLAAARHFQDLRLLLLWGYNENTDTPITYLKKALLRPGAPTSYEWATGKDADGQTWTGVVLKRPVAGPALGAACSISRTASPPPQTEIDKIFESNGRLRMGRTARKALIDMLRSNQLTAGFDKRINEGNRTRENVVATSIKGFTPTGADPVDIVTFP